MYVYIHRAPYGTTQPTLAVVSCCGLLWANAVPRSRGYSIYGCRELGGSGVSEVGPPKLRRAFRLPTPNLQSRCGGGVSHAQVSVHASTLPSRKNFPCPKIMYSAVPLLKYFLGFCPPEINAPRSTITCKKRRNNPLPQR